MWTPKGIACVLAACAAMSCSSWEAGDTTGTQGGAGGVSSTSGGSANCSAPAGPAPATSYPQGIHAQGNSVVDGSGKQIIVHGVNRSGTEYACVGSNGGIFDGPSNEASVRAMASWNINVVRVPLNEACWLGLNGAPILSTATAYKSAIKDYVTLLHKYALIPILELHWAVAGSEVPRAQLPLPNADHTPAFWSDVASTFLDDDGTILELYNEPFWRGTENDAAWQCWRDGCELTNVIDANGNSHPNYQTAGMQDLVKAVRDTGAQHFLLAGGLQFSNSLKEWLMFAPSDPLSNIGAAWHVYNNNACADVNCWSAVPASVAAAYPLVVTEIGENDCQGGFISDLMQFLDSTQLGYLAWSWNANGLCATKTQPWSLITDYNCPIPNGDYATTFHDHVVGFSQ